MKTKILVLLIILAVGFQLHAKERPEAQITFKVVDDTGKPLPGIEMGMATFIRHKPGPNFGKDVNDGPKAKTDEKGVVTLTYPSMTGEFGYGVSQTPGYYYDQGGEFQFKTSKDGKWLPWNPIIERVFKPILNPVPLYAWKVWAVPVPAVDKPFGFDLVESDWVAPFGKGKTADFIFKIERQYESVEKPFDATLTVTFSNDGDGIQPVYSKPYVGSVLRLPRQAPEDGYESKLIRKLYRDAAQPIVSNKREDQNYFFRVRTEKKNGKIVSAMYGKIHGDIEFDIINSPTALLVFTYYLNPTPNDRNLEFDPQKNLFRKLKNTELVQDP